MGMGSTVRSAACFAALSLACATPATASVTVGQVSPGVPISCSNSFEFLQRSSPGNVYAMPAAGQITSWTHRSQVGVGQTPTLKVYRKIAEPATYQVIGRDGPRPVTQNTVTTFPASIAVKAGDVLGITGAGGAVNIGCQFVGQGEIGFFMGALANGAFDAFTPGGSSDRRINVSAVLDPSNAFTLGAVTRNKKKGTATLTANVPNPGQLTASGKGVKAAGARASVAVTTPGKVRLQIKPKGKQKRKLDDSGKVRLKPTITFTPTGGTASSRTTKLKLKKTVG